MFEFFNKLLSYLDLSEIKGLNNYNPTISFKYLFKDHYLYIDLRSFIDILKRIQNIVRNIAREHSYSYTRITDSFISSFFRKENYYTLFDIFKLFQIVVYFFLTLLISYILCNNNNNLSFLFRRYTTNNNITDAYRIDINTNNFKHNNINNFLFNIETKNIIENDNRFIKNNLNILDLAKYNFIIDEGIHLDYNGDEILDVKLRFEEQSLNKLLNIKENLIESKDFYNLLLIRHANRLLVIHTLNVMDNFFKKHFDSKIDLVNNLTKNFNKLDLNSELFINYNNSFEGIEILNFKKIIFFLFFNKFIELLDNKKINHRLKKIQLFKCDNIISSNNQRPIILPEFASSDFEYSSSLMKFLGIFSRFDKGSHLYLNSDEELNYKEIIKLQNIIKTLISQAMKDSTEILEQLIKDINQIYSDDIKSIIHNVFDRKGLNSIDESMHILYRIFNDDKLKKQLFKIIEDKGLNNFYCLRNINIKDEFNKGFIYNKKVYNEKYFQISLDEINNIDQYLSSLFFLIYCSCLDNIKFTSNIHFDLLYFYSPYKTEYSILWIKYFIKSIKNIITLEIFKNLKGRSKIIKGFSLILGGFENFSSNFFGSSIRENFNNTINLNQVSNSVQKGFWNYFYYMISFFVIVMCIFLTVFIVLNQFFYTCNFLISFFIGILTFNPNLLLKIISFVFIKFITCLALYRANIFNNFFDSNVFIGSLEGINKSLLSQFFQKIAFILFFIISISDILWFINSLFFLTYFIYNFYKLFYNEKGFFNEIQQNNETIDSFYKIQKTNNILNNIIYMNLNIILLKLENSLLNKIYYSSFYDISIFKCFYIFFYMIFSVFFNLFDITTFLFSIY